MNSNQSTISPLTKPAISRKGCPRCGGALQTLDKPWIALVAVPVMAFGGVAALFAVGIILAAAIILWPVSCRACGRLRLADFPAGMRARLIAKKVFVALLLVAILFAAQAAFSGWKAIQPQ